MKKFFTKAIVGFLTFNITLMLSGFCVFQLSNISHTAYAAEIQNETTINNALPDGTSCGENAQSKMPPIEDSSSLEIVQGADNSNHTMPSCCIDGSRKGIETIGVSESSKIEMVKSIPVVFFPQIELPVVPPPPKLYNRVCVSPHLSVIRTTVLRL